MTTLYRKYRPQKIDELDIAEVRESLGRVVKSGKIPHAFLFAGPKGTGKTSAARIIAKIVNCEGKGSRPCDKCEQCRSIINGSNIDVIEIDAASHRGIDDVRQLRDAVKLAPAKAKKKIYIIDEAHMLTLEASNALLKTLEEPPEHVIFILATTNPEKLVETIRSRVTSINFRKATIDEVVRSLTRVAKGEHQKVAEEALKLIAKYANGSFRDATKVLEQLLAEGKSFEEKDIEEYLFKTSGIDQTKLLDELNQRNTKEALSGIQGFVRKGGRVMGLLESLMERLRISLLAKIGLGEDELPEFTKNDLIILLKLFAAAARETPGALIEELPLEIAVIQWCEEGGGERVSVKIKPSEEKKEAEVAVQIKKATAALKEVSDEVWKTILVQVKTINTSIEALLRAARPIGYDGKNLTLGVFYRFHKERLEDGHHRRILEDVCTNVMGTPVRVTCTLTEPPVKEVRQEAPEKTVLTEGEDKDIIKVAEEIFGN